MEHITVESNLLAFSKTIIGPVRLEYGHNLNRRPLDPAGTVQLSIGFPF